MILKKFKNDYRKGCIYFLYSKGELVYIGKTATLKRRVYSHRFSLNFTYDTVFYYPEEDGGLRNKLEINLIRQIKPRYNITENPDNYHLHPFYRRLIDKQSA